MIVVSQQSSSITLKLKPMPMEELQQILQDELKAQDIASNLENITDDSLQLSVSQSLMKSMVFVERPGHRPFEVVVDVDYRQSTSNPVMVRTKKPSSDSENGGVLGNSRWILYLVIFGGVIISFLSNLFAPLIQSLLGPVFGELTTTQMLLIVLTTFFVILVVSYFGVPFILQFRRHQLKQFDHKILNILTSRINTLQAALSAEISRCWSCFRELDKHGEFCPHCGKAQG